MQHKHVLNRRDFVKMGGTGLFSALAFHPILKYGKVVRGLERIDSIKLYMINVTKARNFSHGTWTNRQHVFMQMTGGGYSGWSEALASKNNPSFDLGGWSKFMEHLPGMNISDAFGYAAKAFSEKRWERDQSELVQLALYDLDCKINHVPVIDSWQLDHDKPVPGVFTILENEVEMVLKEAAIARQQGLVSHVKMKMFGIEELDNQIVVALRHFFGTETFLMADANRGYRKVTDMDELVRILDRLHKNGLDAMEDPSELDVTQWIELQKKVKPLALIPDYIMRPAPHGLKIFNPEMGQYFNLHPDQMGSLADTTELAKKIVRSGKGLMIGDSSFIGPSCTIWQQIAIGAGASWVETIEKPQESDVFMKCVKEIATQRSKNGLVSLKEKRPGFGLVMDDEKLRQLADAFYKLG